jgi:hypothetical protein
LQSGLEPTNLLDVLRDTQHWLNWTRFLWPISGHDAKLDEPRLPLPGDRVLLWLPSRSSAGRRGLWATSTGGNSPGFTGDTFTEEGLDKAIREVI